MDITTLESNSAIFSKVENKHTLWPRNFISRYLEAHTCTMRHILGK